MNYIYFILMCSIAICFFILPLNFKKILLTSIFIFLFSFGVYQVTGNSDALNQWLDKGKQHYQLLMQYNELGGIDGIIQKIEAKLKIHPDDKQGWFILGKLYLSKNQPDKAKIAFKKAEKTI